MDPIQKYIAYVTAFQTVVMAVAGWIGWSILRSFRSGQWLQEKIDDIEGLRRKMTELEHETDAAIASVSARMNEAGQKCSDLADQVQTLPDRLREIFVTRELYSADQRTLEVIRTDLRRDVESIFESLRKLRDDVRGFPLRGRRNDG